MGDFVLQLKDAETVLNANRRVVLDPPARVMSTNATSFTGSGNVTVASESEDTDNPDDDAIKLGVQGSVCFQACDEQEGNSCGPHSVRNALLALGNEYAGEIDLSKIDVKAPWIDVELKVASSAKYDPLGLVHSHVLHIPMLSALRPLEPDLCQHGVDPMSAPTLPPGHTGLIHPGDSPS